MNKLTIRDLDASGKRVFVRVDFNVPLEDGKITDDQRIRASIPTIRALTAQGARVILASHLGRPDGKVQDGLRLRPVAERLTQLLRQNVPVTGDALGLGTEDAVKRLRPGEVLLLENLRFHAEEEKNDPAFARKLAAYADVYVNDAFGTAHRAHASTVGIAKILPAYAGLLMEREIEMLSRLLENPEHPFAAVLGGAKVSDKIKVVDNLLTKVDLLVLGGGMANTFLLAQGRSIGKSLAEPNMVDEARRILVAAEEKGVQIVLPVDVIVAKEVTRGTEYKTLPAEKIPASWHIVDVGKKTLDLMTTALSPAKTVFWNGPLGVFEIPVFGAGTRAVARLLADMAEAGATVVVGGGDSVAAIEQQGLADKMTHISTGGGASLEFLEGRELPGVAVLLDRPVDEAEPERPAAPAKRPAAVTEPAKARPTDEPAPKLAATAPKPTDPKPTATAPKPSATPKPSTAVAPKPSATPKPSTAAAPKPSAPKPSAAAPQPVAPKTTAAAPKPPAAAPNPASKPSAATPKSAVARPAAPKATTPKASATPRLRRDQRDTTAS